MKNPQIGSAKQEQHTKSYNRKVQPKESALLGRTHRWEAQPDRQGPYMVVGLASVGAYCLAELDGKPVSRPWNIYNLTKF